MVKCKVWCWQGESMVGGWLGVCASDTVRWDRPSFPECSWLQWLFLSSGLVHILMKIFCSTCTLFLVSPHFIIIICTLSSKKLLLCELDGQDTVFFFLEWLPSFCLVGLCSVSFQKLFELSKRVWSLSYDCNHVTVLWISLFSEIQS
jgi:hypothetical protein